MKLVIGLLALTAMGCATARTLTGPDGTEHQLVHCSNINMCYDKAREVCGGNYKIVNTSNEVTGGAQGTSTSTDLLIKCEGPKSSRNTEL